MNIREFNLINELGQSYSFMDIDTGAFLSSPSGLGYSYKNSYQKLGNVFINSLTELSQGSVTGKVYFTKYENYRKLINFIHKSTKLMLMYVVPYEKSTKTYYKDVEVTNISKGDKDKNGLLSCSITLTSLSLWYEKIITKYIVEDDGTTTIWDFYFDSYFPSYSSRDLDYINDGDVNASIEVNIDGEVTNPTMKLYIEGELQQEIKIPILIQQHEKLCYSSKEDNFYIKLKKEDGTYESLFTLDYISFENDNVIRIPPGKQCRLVISSDDSVEVADLTIYAYYVSV